MKELQFPAGFVWGTASAAYQIEGAIHEDGRGESIWDRYCSIPGNIANGDTGEIACDHYHRYKEDIALMRQMGMKAYRFSVAWPRIFPDGTGKLNEKGLDFYSRLIDELEASGIDPYLTLYHWDLPQALQDRGGWVNPDTAKRFLEYSSAVMQKLKGRVKHWITLNEPYCAAFLGYYAGRQAPGIRDFSSALRAAYNLYLGHGEAVRYFRENAIPGEIGIALNLMGRLPLTETSTDRDAAFRADGQLNRWFLDPLIKGGYPADMTGWFSKHGVVLPPFNDASFELIKQPLDFIGLNYYNDFYVKHDGASWPLEFAIENPRWIPVNSRDWPITEQGFTAMLLRLKKEYGIERILITENGTSTSDTVTLVHTVEDYPRVDYLKRHIAAMHQAIEAGVGVCGYMQWSLLDNFEWSFGYNSRFGLVYVDFQTQERIIKRSGHWYAALAKNNSMSIGNN
jgi:beta-glucosidase